MGDMDDDVLDMGSSAGIGSVGPIAPICLVGKLLTEKNINQFALLDVMSKTFRPKGKLTARAWGKGLVLFSFEHSEDRAWVCRNQPWHFEGWLFLIKPFSGAEQPSSIQLSMASFWVRVHDLPLTCRSEFVLRSIAAKIGRLEAFEKPSKSDVGEFLRHKVEFNVTKLLCKGLMVKFDGVNLWVPLT
ncbi:hypothetical protein ACS0TY_033235 [Phlomoides rotata]